MTETRRFVIASRDTSLTFDSPTKDSYRLSLAAPDVVVRDLQVWHLGGDGIGPYFSELAAAWRGWTGEREWHSLEHQLVLSTSISKGGSISLRVQLRDSSRDDWEVRYDLRIENGVLDRLAAEATAFGRLLGAAP